MSDCNLFSIYQQIEQLRKEMLNLAHRYGLNDPKVIECSQELDKFILLVQKK